MTEKTNETRALTATGKDDWLTPRPVLDSLDEEFGFDLDAAASDGNEAFPGGPYLTAEDDALSVPWMDYLGSEASAGPVAWLNSPYSRAAGRGHGIKAWHEKAWEESRNGLTVVVLCPPHPGRGWFTRWARLADEIRVYTKRISFIDPATMQPVKGNTQDSCLVIYRPHVPETGWPGGPRWSWIEVPR